MILTAVLCVIIILGFQCFIPIQSTEELREAFYVKCKNIKLPNEGSVQEYLKSPSQCINKCNLQYFCIGVNVKKIQECVYSCELHMNDSRLIPDCTDGSIVSETGIDSFIKRKIFYSSFSVTDRLCSIHMKSFSNTFTNKLVRFCLRILEFLLMIHSNLLVYIHPSDKISVKHELAWVRRFCDQRIKNAPSEMKMFRYFGSEVTENTPPSIGRK